MSSRKQSRSDISPATHSDASEIKDNSEGSELSDEEEQSSEDDDTCKEEDERSLQSLWFTKEEKVKKV